MKFRRMDSMLLNSPIDSYWITVVWLLTCFQDHYAWSNPLTRSVHSHQPFRPNPGNKLALKKKPPTTWIVSGWSLSWPRWARTIDPLIMSLLFSIYYLLRRSWDFWVIVNSHRTLCIYTSIINCLLYVKYYTGLHGFVGILARKLAHVSRGGKTARLTTLVRTELSGLFVIILKNHSSLILSCL